MNRRCPSVNGNITKIPANKEGIQFPDRKVELKIGPGFKKCVEFIRLIAAACESACVLLNYEMTYFLLNFMYLRKGDSWPCGDCMGAELHGQ